MKILIAYASKNGCTEACAQKLAEKLKGDTVLVNLRKQTMTDLTAYDLIVAGSCIRMGQVHSAVKKFCEKNSAALAEKKYAFFLCCGSAENAATYYSGGFSPDLLEGALAAACFGGEMDVEKLKGLDKLIAKAVTKSTAAEHKPLPQVLPEAIDRLAEIINGQG